MRNIFLIGQGFIASPTDVPLPQMSSNYLAYFILNKQTLTARCKLCPDGKKNEFKFSDKSKTNLKAHLTSQHSNKLSEIKQELKSANPFTMSAISSDEQAKITDAVVDYVIEDDQPITLPEKPSFRKLMCRVKPSWRPICRKTCRSKIICKGKPFAFNYAAYKAKYGKPSATVDLWTSRQRLGYMAVTLHLQNEHRAASKVLDVADIPSPTIPRTLPKSTIVS